jgi:hypothetical protein
VSVKTLIQNVYYKNTKSEKMHWLLNKIREIKTGRDKERER